MAPLKVPACLVQLKPQSHIDHTDDFRSKITFTDWNDELLASSDLRVKHFFSKYRRAAGRTCLGGSEGNEWIRINFCMVNGEEGRRL